MNDNDFLSSFFLRLTGQIVALKYEHFRWSRNAVGLLLLLLLLCEKKDEAVAIQYSKSIWPMCCSVLKLFG